ncbi:hypothetical protein Golax_024467 [Gossypium laxum]|uniref:Uncharacterized protein n=2 Tax=Gossypium TaxID=3633 RepID=A0A7J8ZCY2_9ROSI|nr:hypothetical protein [Gossypium laxum]
MHFKSFREKVITKLTTFQLQGSLKLTKRMTESHCREHLIEDCIFFYTVTVMQLLAGNPCGIFQKKFMIQRRRCASVQSLP